MKRIAMLLLLSFGCTTPQQDQKPIKASSPIKAADQAAAGAYIIHVNATGKCVDISGDRVEAGVPIQQYDCANTSSQSFRVLDGGNGYLVFQGTKSGKVIDNPNASNNNGNKLWQWDLNNSPAQKWKLQQVNGGFAMINQGSGKCLDIDLGGSYAQQWDCNLGQANQTFTFTQVAGNTPPPNTNTGGNGGGNETNNGQGNNGQNVKISVKNGCGFPIYIHAAGAQAVLQPDNAQLSSGQSRDYLAPRLWVSGRVEARRDQNLGTDPTEKVEMTFDQGGGTTNLNYNVTYVDYMGLPVAVSSSGRGGDCKRAACDQPLSNFTNGCPAGLMQNGACVSLRTHCLDGRYSGEAICHTLDAKVDECRNKYGDCRPEGGAASPQVFACSGPFFSESPRYCAAINRGMLNNPSDADRTHYYQQQPYNTYSKFVHEKCPALYAFPYDDYPSSSGESGYHSCTDGSALNITFCPKG